MKFLFDLLPVVLFFVAFKLADIYVATAVAIATSVLQVAWLKLRRQRVPGMLWASLGIIVVFGGATLLLQDKTFIMWKPTVLYALFGVILAAGKLAFGRDLLAYVMKGVTLPPRVWTRLTWAWVAFFAFMAFANWYVAFHYSEQTWVLYKVWGGIGLFFVFAIAQGAGLGRTLQGAVHAGALPRRRGARTPGAPAPGERPPHARLRCHRRGTPQCEGLGAQRLGQGRPRRVVGQVHLDVALQG